MNSNNLFLELMNVGGNAMFLKFVLDSCENTFSPQMMRVPIPRGVPPTPRKRLLLGLKWSGRFELSSSRAYSNNSEKCQRFWLGVFKAIFDNKLRSN